MSTVVGVEVVDVPFDQSVVLGGSALLIPDVDHHAARLRISTDAHDEHEGHSFVVTVGHGTLAQLAAIKAVAHRVVGRDVEAILDDLGGLWRELVPDSQKRCRGPEDSIMHLAIGAVLNAFWDLKAKRAGLPLWQLLSRMAPDELVDLIDFHYLSDVLTREEALGILRAAAPGRAVRESELLANGYPAWKRISASAGLSDGRLRNLAREIVSAGFEQVTLNVGVDLHDDIRRVGVVRDAVGPRFRIAVDAQERWERDQAIDWIGALESFNLAWVEAPTNSDDIFAHAAIARGVAPVPIAVGESGLGRIAVKQLLLSEAAAVVQIDSTRVPALSESVALLVLAAKFGVPICSRGDAVGAGALVQHLAMFDFVAVSGSLTNRMIEYSESSSEYFAHPVIVDSGHFRTPRIPGSGMEMLRKPSSDQRSSQSYLS